MSVAIGESVHLLMQTANVKYTYVAGITLLVYDTLISLSGEINLIWVQRWSIGKILYIVTRYSGFLDASFFLWYSFSTIESCRDSFSAAVWSVTIGISICHVVLVIRTFAIWERNIGVLVYVCLLEVVHRAFHLAFKLVPCTNDAYPLFTQAGFVSKIILMNQALKSTICTSELILL